MEMNPDLLSHLPIIPRTKTQKNRQHKNVSAFSLLLNNAVMCSQNASYKSQLYGTFTYVLFHLVHVKEAGENIVVTLEYRLIQPVSEV